MLSVKEKLENILRELLVSQITMSIDLGKDDTISDEVRVHELRKAIKRSRALLLLLKPALDEKTYLSLDALFGKSAHLLADQREATVNLQTFINLINNSRDSLPLDLKNQILERLSIKVNHAYNLSLNNLPSQLKTCLLSLNRSKTKILSLPLHQLDEKNLSALLKKSYKKASKLYKDARSSRDTEIIHKWRKLNKHLLYQLKLLPLAKDRKTNSIISILVELSNTLGNEHDLAIMEEYLQANFSFKEEEERQMDLIVLKERNRLQKEAFKLGAKLYA